MKITRFAVIALLAVSSCAAQKTARLVRRPGMVSKPRSADPIVWDDGSQTYFRFPGNMRIPRFFVVNPDQGSRRRLHGERPNPHCHRASDGTGVPPARWRFGPLPHEPSLRPDRAKSSTGTTSPDVERVLRASK